MLTNLSLRCAAFSALITFVSKNLVKVLPFEKTAPAGIGGPNIGTFLLRVTAMLKTFGQITQLRSTLKYEYWEYRYSVAQEHALTAKI